MSGIKGEYIYNEKGEIIGATGGKLASMVNRAKYGEDYYQKIGQAGGAVKGVNKGFAGMDREKVVEAGRKGGKISKRSY